jgi:hypothetical protein
MLYDYERASVLSLTGTGLAFACTGGVVGKLIGLLRPRKEGHIAALQMSSVTNSRRLS